MIGPSGKVCRRGRTSQTRLMEAAVMNREGETEAALELQKARRD